MLSSAVFPVRFDRVKRPNFHPADEMPFNRHPWVRTRKLRLGETSCSAKKTGRLQLESRPTWHPLMFHSRRPRTFLINRPDAGFLKSVGWLKIPVAALFRKLIYSRQPEMEFVMNIFHSIFFRRFMAAHSNSLVTIECHFRRIMR